MPDIICRFYGNIIQDDTCTQIFKKAQKNPYKLYKYSSWTQGNSFYDSYIIADYYGNKIIIDIRTNDFGVSAFLLIRQETYEIGSVVISRDFRRISEIILPEYNKNLFRLLENSNIFVRQFVSATIRERDLVDELLRR